MMMFYDFPQSIKADTETISKSTTTSCYPSFHFVRISNSYLSSFFKPTVEKGMLNILRRHIEDEDITVLQDIGNHLQDYKASRLGRTPFTVSQPSEPHFSSN
jgi:hypothetical protein